MRSAATSTLHQLPRGEPVAVPDDKADKVLVALHHRPGMGSHELAVMVSTMTPTLLPMLKVMEAKGAIKSEPATLLRGSSLVWKLTQAGAKEAVFAIHRAKKTGPKSTFVGGLNPWTGAKMRL